MTELPLHAWPQLLPGETASSQKASKQGGTRTEQEYKKSPVSFHTATSTTASSSPSDCQAVHSLARQTLSSAQLLPSPSVLLPEEQREEPRLPKLGLGIKVRLREPLIPWERNLKPPPNFFSPKKHRLARPPKAKQGRTE